VYFQRTLLDLVDHVYGAVENEALWPTFLDGFAHTFQAQIGTLYIHDLRTQHGGTELVTGMDLAYDRAYRAYYASRNVYMTQGKALLVAGNVMTSEELCPDEKVLPSEFYNEWIRPQGLGQGLNGVLFNEGSLAGSIGAIRARGAKSFTVEDRRLMHALMPHLQRAVRLRRRIEDLEILKTRTGDALDHWTTAVFLVNPDARVILANRTAVDLLEQRDGLLVEHGMLITARSKDTVMLQRLIRQAVATTIDRNDHASGVMLIQRISGKCPLQILVAPSVREDIFFGTRGTAILFVSDPETQRTQADVLRTLYGLTPAEAAVASLLAEGKSVKEIADRTTVRENTVRMHLKKIFDKTGTKRQAELVKIVLSGHAALRTRR
jgi:DNA-binding CsgD family transcriptional regulator